MVQLLCQYALSKSEHYRHVVISLAHASNKNYLLKSKHRAYFWPAKNDFIYGFRQSNFPSLFLSYYRLIIHQLDLIIKSLNPKSWIGTLTNSTLQEVAEIQTSSVSKHLNWNRNPHCHIWTLQTTTFEGKHLPVPVYRKTRNDEVRPLMNSTQTCFHVLWKHLL